MEQNLTAFFSALDRMRPEKPAEAEAVLARKRAAGTLIAQDIFFAAPRRLPGIRKLVQAQIPDAGFFPGDWILTSAFSDHRRDERENSPPADRRN